MRRRGRPRRRYEDELRAATERLGVVASKPDDEDEGPFDVEEYFNSLAQNRTHLPHRRTSEELD